MSDEPRIVPTISTGEPSTLDTYRRIALILSGDETSKAVKFFDEKIASSPNGKDEVVVVDERQVLYLIGTMITGEFNPDARKEANVE